MNPGEEDAVRSLLRLASLYGLGGAALGLGAGALRASNPRYVPPEPPAPVVVDMPVPARDGFPATQIPIPSKTKPTKPAALPEAKKAGLSELFSRIGDAVSEYLPSVYHPLGPVGAQNRQDIPLYGAAAIPAVVGGGFGGFALGDRVARAVERRRAQAELDEARQEYQNAVTQRTAKLYFPKTASGVIDLLEGRTPTDPNLARVKIALDAAWMKKTADDVSALPTPDHAISADDPGRGASRISKTLMGWAWPGLLHKDTAPIQMGVLAGLGGIGAYSGYRWARDEDEATAVRRATEAKDRANATKIPAPVIARLVPVQA